MKRTSIAIASLASLLSSGCTHTVIGGLRADSPDKLYVLGSTAHGASGKAFTALSTKRVQLWIATNPIYNEFGLVTNRPATLFAKKYIVKAADLGTHVCWATPEAVCVDFYDYGDCVLRSGRRGQPSNHVASISFRLDRQTGKFQQLTP